MESSSTSFARRRRWKKKATNPTCTLIVTNALPVAGTDMFMGTQNVALTFNASALLGNDSDLEGDGLSLLAVSGVAPLTYSANFDDGLVPTNSSVTGVAGGGLVAGSGGVNNSGYLKLTDGVSPGSAAGAMVINELTPGRRVSAFSASFMLRIGDGSAHSLPPAFTSTTCATARVNGR